MPKLNENYLQLKESYLFSEIAHRTAAYSEKHPDKPVIRLGIGDVTRPLCECAIKALHESVDEMGQSATFKGYGPEQGYAKTRDAIAAYYKRNGVEVDADAIFISDGAKSDTGNITELFGHDNVILIPDPVYPVYVDSNTMCGNKVTYISGNADNDFLPMPDHSQHVDVIYICSPNNPTGACYNKEQLKEWVDYALENEAVILYDSAYEAFISDPELPRSIYTIEGARKCAIEFCSLSKTAGFTGTRCGYTVVPKELVFTSSDGREMSLNAMWKPPSEHQIQRNLLHRTERGSSHLLRRRNQRMPGKPELLQKECQSHCRRPDRTSDPVLRWYPLPIHLVRVPERHGLLDLLRLLT